MCCAPPSLRYGCCCPNLGHRGGHRSSRSPPPSVPMVVPEANCGTGARTGSKPTRAGIATGTRRCLCAIRNTRGRARRGYRRPGFGSDVAVKWLATASREEQTVESVRWRLPCAQYIVHIQPIPHPIYRRESRVNGIFWIRMAVGGCTGVGR